MVFNEIDIQKGVEFVCNWERPSGYSKKESESNDILCIFMKKFRMCTIVIDALTPLNRASGVNMYKDITRFRLFCTVE